MSLARRLTRAPCRGHPRRRHPVALKCHRRTVRERWATTRLWARDHARWFLLPVWACGRPALVQHPAERALPSRRDPRPVRSIPLLGGIRRFKGDLRTQENKNTEYVNVQVWNTIHERGEKESPKDCSCLKSCESLYTCPHAPFIGRRREFYIPKIPSNLRNIPSVNMYMNVFYIP
jgi:hypothetical protein